MHPCACSFARASALSHAHTDGNTRQVWIGRVRPSFCADLSKEEDLGDVRFHPPTYAHACGLLEITSMFPCVHETMLLTPSCIIARRADNPKGWVNYGEYRGSLAAFLFTFPDGDTTKNPIKLQKVGGAGLAQIDDGSGPKVQKIFPHAPCVHARALVNTPLFSCVDQHTLPLIFCGQFGASDLAVPLKGGSILARSKLGSYYERMPDGGNSIIFDVSTGSPLREAELISLRVYIGVYGPDEYIPFTDAEPFALN